MNDKVYLRVKKLLNDHRLNNEIGDTSKILREDVIEMCEAGMFDPYEVKLLNGLFRLNTDRSIAGNGPLILALKRPKNISDWRVYLESLKMDNTQVSNIIKYSIAKDRDAIEYDDNYLQLIPNMIVKDRNGIVLLHKKKKSSRTYDTIGLPAGHVDVLYGLVSGPDSNKEIYLLNVIKELQEELGIPEKIISDINSIGIIKHVPDVLNVSHYHIGITTIVTLRDLDFRAFNKEPDKHDLVYYHEVVRDPVMRRKMENWCIESLIQYFDYEEGRKKL